MPDKNPGLWVTLMLWLYNHQDEAGYAALAGGMALLRAAYVGRDSKTRRVIDAAICSVFAFFLQPTLEIFIHSAGAIIPALNLPVSKEIAQVLAVFLGFLGTDFISSRLKKQIDKRLGEPDENQ